MILHCNLFSQQNLKLLGRSENFAASEINDEIWIATLNKGYNRYRGVDTKHYLLNDKKSGLKGTYISSSLHKDKKESFGHRLKRIFVFLTKVLISLLVFKQSGKKVS